MEEKGYFNNFVNAIHPNAYPHKEKVTKSKHSLLATVAGQ